MPGAKQSHTTEAKVLTRIQNNEARWVFTPADFADLGTEASVHAVLSRLAKSGEIRRLARGFYDVPRKHPELGMLAPSPDAIARALQSRDGIRLQPTGAHAANLLGLSDQVPAKIVFFTDGRSRIVQVGNQQIVLKRRSSRAMATAGKLSGLIIHALDYLGKNLVDDVVIDRLRAKLTQKDRQTLLDDVRYAPAWISDIMRALATEACESNGDPQIEEAPTVAKEDEAKFDNAKVIEGQALAGTATTVNQPPVHVIIEGTKPVKQTPGRKKNLFAPKSSRIVHWLLLHPAREWRAREIGEATGIDSGHLSRILARLCEKELIERDGRSIYLPKAATLLEAWREAYTPPCGNILKGVIPSKSGRETMAALEKRLRAARRRYAFTGFGAAYLWGGQADFHLVTCYLEGKLSTQLKRKLRFVECEEEAANVWIMEYADQVAFLGSERRLQTQVASPVFTYLDLAIQPEGAEVAAVCHPSKYYDPRAVISVTRLLSKA